PRRSLEMRPWPELVPRQPPDCSSGLLFRRPIVGAGAKNEGTLTLRPLQLVIAATPTYRPALALIAYTGLRASEALGLTWEDVDLQEQVIQVRAQLERADGNRKAVRRKLKTPAANRLVPIPARLHEILTKHREQRSAVGFAEDSDYLLGTATGAPMRYDNLR